MTKKQPLVTSHTDWASLLPNPPITSSFQSSWRSIQLAHFHQPSMCLPEISNAQHIVAIPLGHHAVDVEFISEGRSRQISYRERDYEDGVISIIPADLPHSVRSDPKAKSMELVLCYLEPDFLAQVAHDSIKPENVEILHTPLKVDRLIKQIGLSLKSNLKVDKTGRRFYADSMATALAAHLLHHYSTRKHNLREYEDGLSKQKLKQAFDYMQAHLGENLSLNEVANDLGMSQYYFCRLFKQSTGVSPHQYLIRQRVEQAKHLLKNPERSITWIALECGFANQSHFAKCFRQHTGMNPNQFRKL
jgi:AraC family transcriptional regulator